MSKLKFQRKILDYQIIIYPDRIIGNNKTCFTAYCPVLELADSGETIEEALKNITSLIEFHLECLKKEKTTIPEEIIPNLITTTRVSIPVR
jgi:predicted RNase H-like HicB family nuclease